MATRQYTNNAAATLLSAITSGQTGLTVSSGQGALFPTLSGGNYTTLTVASGATAEIIKATARATDYFTIVRGQEGTSPAGFPAGSAVELRATAASFAAFTTPNFETLTVDTTSGQTSGTDEDDLISYEIPANTLVADGDRIDIYANGVYAANGNNKRIRLYIAKTGFAGQLLLDTDTVTTNNAGWVLHARLTRTSATALWNISVMTVGSGVYPQVTGSFVTTNVDWTLPMTTKITGQSSNGTSGDIVCTLWHVDLLRA